MKAKLPVLACTDLNTNIGKVITEGEFGWWCESNNTDELGKIIKKSLQCDLHTQGNNAFKYLNEFWNIRKQYANIIKTID